MNTITCPHCATEHSWQWEEAVDKFCFKDGEPVTLNEEVLS